MPGTTGHYSQPTGGSKPNIKIAIGKGAHSVHTSLWDLTDL